jgi:hypothetical protein
MVIFLFCLHIEGNFIVKSANLCVKLEHWGKKSE